MGGETISQGGACGDPGILPSPPPGDAASTNVPPLSAPRWPDIALFRWEEHAGPRDAWDALKFPKGGPGVLGRLRAVVLGSKLHGRNDDRVPSLFLSAALSVGGAPQLFPMDDDEDIEKIVQLMRLMCPASAGVIAIAVRAVSRADELPVDFWTCVFNAVTSCRHVIGNLLS